MVSDFVMIIFNFAWLCGSFNVLDCLYSFLDFNPLILSPYKFQRHYAMEHGGNMSRSKRNAALQVGVLFVNLVV